MNRREFLKALGLATVAASTASIIGLKPSGPYIRHCSFYSTEHDKNIHRLDWSDGKIQCGVDFDTSNPDMSEEDAEYRLVPALHVLKDHIERKGLNIRNGIPLEFPKGVKSSYLDKKWVS